MEEIAIAVHLPILILALLSLFFLDKTKNQVILSAVLCALAALSYGFRLTLDTGNNFLLFGLVVWTIVCIARITSLKLRSKTDKPS